MLKHMEQELAINGGKPVRKEKIYYGRQMIGQDDIAAVMEVLKSDWLTQGPWVTELEHKLCGSFGAEYAVTATSGTSALHLACIAADIRPGEEVITTPLTFAASANCIRYCGGTVVFADVDEQSMTIDPQSVISRISDKTRAILAVDYAGQPSQLKELRSICDAYGLILIEDAAHSFGSVYQGKPIGSIADLTTFSFHPVKAITGGEGGAVLCSKKRYYDIMRLAANHGITKDPSLFADKTHSGEAWYCEQLMLGYNFRMTDMQAALICSQAEKLNQFRNRRKEIVAQYNEAFSKIDGLVLPKALFDSDPCWHLYVIRLDEASAGCTRKELFDALSAENVQPQVHYVPVHLHPYYRSLGHHAGECPVSEKICRQILSLPLYPAMTRRDVEDVIAAVQKVCAYYQRRGKI